MNFFTLADVDAETLFRGFDTKDTSDIGSSETEAFLAAVLQSPETPQSETRSLYETSLTSGCEDWLLQVRCAAAILRRNLRHRQLWSRDALAAQDVLAYLPVAAGSHRHVALPRQTQQQREQDGWRETDRLIRELESSLLGRSLRCISTQHELESEPASKSSKGARRKRASVTTTKAKSPYWTCSQEDSAGRTGHGLSATSSGGYSAEGRFHVSDLGSGGVWPKASSATSGHDAKASCQGAPERPRRSATKQAGCETHQLRAEEPGQDAHLGHSSDLDADNLVRLIPAPSWALDRHVANISSPEPEVTRTRSPIKSPFFATPPASSSKRDRGGRPVAGTVPATPFPPLTDDRFPIIQDELSREPFWLLVAVTFLIKTAGKVAIPAFRAVQERFPTPAHLADPEATEPLRHMIRHLGLSAMRTTMIQRYARGWLERPPKAGVTYRVRGYERREDLQCHSTVADDEPQGKEEELDDGALEVPSPTKMPPTVEADDSWEIGHLTQGKYALDSWRIFCRDELLGRAEDWNGGGAPPEFQPEWMRVRPGDKELRACLRWMWMREGWEWDPNTGDRRVVRPEMASAVNEGRVAYDQTGGLRILEEPRTRPGPGPDEEDEKGEKRDQRALG